MNKEVQDSVLSALSEYASPSVFQPNKLVEINLADVVNDSLSLLEVVYDLEDKYKVMLQPERLTELQTVADLVNAIDQEVTTLSRRL